jgi:WD40 repeat protein
LTVLSNGSLVSGSFGEIKIWNPYSGQLLRTLNGHTQNVHNLKIINNGNLLSSDYSLHLQTQIKIWELSTGALLKEFTMKSSRDVVALENGHMVTASKEKVQIWNLQDGSLINEIAIDSRTDVRLAALHNGDLAFTTTYFYDCIIHIIDPMTGVFKTNISESDLSEVSFLSELSNNELLMSKYQVDSRTSLNIYDLTNMTLKKKIKASRSYSAITLKDGRLAFGSLTDINIMNN